SHISMRGDIAFAGHRPKFRTLSMHAEPRVLTYLGFGRQEAIAGEVEFRHALSAAIGRAGMEQISSGEKVQPTLSVLPRSERGRLVADSKKATRLMALLAKRYPAIDAGTLSLELIVN